MKVKFLKENSIVEKHYGIPKHEIVEKTERKKRKTVKRRNGNSFFHKR